jgi:hypothetical protein
MLIVTFSITSFQSESYVNSTKKIETKFEGLFILNNISINYWFYKLDHNNKI